MARAVTCHSKTRSDGPYRRINDLALTRPDYGYMWWLNTDRKAIPAAPASAFWAAGFGGNYIYVDQENDLLIVLRWVPALPEVVTAVRGTIRP